MSAWIDDLCCVDVIRARWRELGDCFEISSATVTLLTLLTLPSSSKTSSNPQATPRQFFYGDEADEAEAENLPRRQSAGATRRTPEIRTSSMCCEVW